ncbi:MAG: hypothetical protein R3322_18500 [Kiloniellales bacterium]|nr:hypothetical protein [Kiloniellales bacterium]
MSERARPAGPARTKEARTNRTKKARKKKAPSEATGRRDKQHLDEILDEALEETFPASDPIELTADKA